VSSGQFPCKEQIFLENFIEPTSCSLPKKIRGKIPAVKRSGRNPKEHGYERYLRTFDEFMQKKENHPGFYRSDLPNILIA